MRSPTSIDNRFLTLAASMVAICLGNLPCRSAEPTGYVLVTLNSSTVARTPEVTLAQIAKVETSSRQLRDYVEALDITAAPSPGQSISVTRKQVDFRLRLAGVDPGSFTIRGSQAEVKGLTEPDAPILSASRNVELESPFQPVASRGIAAVGRANASPQNSDRQELRQSVTADLSMKTIEEVVMSAARKVVMDQLPWNPQDVSIRVVQPMSRELKSEPDRDCVCTATLRTSGPPIGRVNVDATVQSSKSGSFEVPVVLEVRHYETVVSTVRPIPRGRKIQSEDLYLHRWDVTGVGDYCTQPDKLVGRVAGRPLAAIQLIREQDLEQGYSGNNSERTIVVKRGSRLKLVARIGDLLITTPAEAMQDGRAGETIKVQNSDSKLIVPGRVVSPEEVEAVY